MVLEIPAVAIVNPAVSAYTVSRVEESDYGCSRASLSTSTESRVSCIVIQTYLLERIALLEYRSRPLSLVF